MALVESNTLAKSHQRLERAISSVTDEEEFLLHHLNKHLRPDCSDAALAQARQLVFATRFVRDIGFVDHQNRRICSAVAGILPEPAPLELPTLREIRNGVDQSIWFNFPLAMGPNHYKALIMQQGQFFVVVNQQSFSSLIRDVDVLGLQLADALPSRVYQSDRITPFWSTYFDEQTALKRPKQGFDWTIMSLVRTDYIPGTPWVIQSYLSGQDILLRQEPMFVLLLVTIMFSGLLITAFVTPVLARQKSIGARLRNLLKEGGIQCYYQPIVDLKSRHWIGCEVLMRIRDGDCIVAPQEALPEIVRQGLEWELDTYMLQHAMAELAQSMPITNGFKVAVNLMPKNISFHALANFLSPLLRALDRPDLQLGLEIVEHSYDDTVIHEIAALRKAGFAISVDDFGTGYSNLGRVKHLAPDVLKIDRTFVHEMEDHVLRSSLIPEIVSIGRAVGSQLVAEGIENELQAEQLQQLGVDYGQGYLFAKPLPLQAFVKAYMAQNTLLQDSTHT
nr:EAL domain-containing protein [Aquitalea sp. ASV11]